MSVSLPLAALRLCVLVLAVVLLVPTVVCATVGFMLCACWRSVQAGWCGWDGLCEWVENTAKRGSHG